MDLKYQADVSSELFAVIAATQQEIATAKLDLKRNQKLICQRAQKLTRADGAVIEIAEGDKMVYRAATGSVRHQVGLALKLHGSLSGLSVLTGKILSCEDSESDPRVDKGACRKVGLRSMLVVPLNHDGKNVGALKVISRRPGQFNEGHVQVLQLLAGIMAATLRNAATFAENQNLIRQLQETLARINILSGLLPICAWCKRIRDDQGYWNKLESYLARHSEVSFTHGVCPECENKANKDLDK